MIVISSPNKILWKAKSKVTSVNGYDEGRKHVESIIFDNIEKKGKHEVVVEEEVYGVMA